MSEPLIKPWHTALALIALHPDWSVRKMARYLYNEYPDKFPSLDVARCVIRKLKQPREDLQ
jgi:hypothetical protein